MSTLGATDLKYLMENSPDIVCRASMHFVLSYVSPSSVKVLGWTPLEMLAKGLPDLVYVEDMPELVAGRDRTHAADGGDTPSTVRMWRKDGTLVWIEIKPTMLRDEITGEPLPEAVIVLRDVTERKLLEDRLALLAMTDGLTGLANRRAFDTALGAEWKRTLREGSEMSLLLLDIDHFKGLNDRYGHQVGDDCLRAVGATVMGMVRATDTAARYGGEELAVILPGIGMAGAAETAERLRAAIEALRLDNAANRESGGVVTVSIGAATALARHGGTMSMPEGLLQAADKALYKAKRGGRNRVEGGLLIAPQALQTA